MISINDTIEIKGPKNKKQYVYMYDNIYKEGDEIHIQTTILVSDTEDELLEVIAEKKREFQNKYNALSPEDKRLVQTLRRKRNEQ